jgi:hypothetical protein
MGTRADFRNYAHQCIELARKTNNSTTRETLLEMAEIWLGLAGVAVSDLEQLRANGFAADGIGPAQRSDLA